MSATALALDSGRVGFDLRVGELVCVFTINGGG